MALIVCPDCGKNFSDAAAACPNCARPNKTAQSRSSTAPAPAAKKNPGCFAIGCGTLIVLAIIGSLVDEGTNKGTSSTSTASTSAATSSQTTPSGTHITKAGYSFCYTVDDFNELTDYLVKNDKRAAAQMIVSGDCGFLEAGMEVDVVDTKILSGMVQIRKVGSRTTFWTNMEAI